MPDPSSLAAARPASGAEPSPATDALADTEGGRPLGPVLLATDRSPLAVNAGRVALALTRRTGAAPVLVHVIDPRGAAPPPTLDVAVGLADATAGGALRATLAGDLRRTLGEALAPALGPGDPPPDSWAVRIAVGAPAEALVREATAVDAGLVVLGLHRRGPLGRAFRDETALQVLRHAPCPVLAVAAGLQSAPQRAVVGIDFGAASTRAAHLAARLLAPGGRLVLAHAPVTPQAPAGEGEALVHALGVSAAFDALAAALPRRGELTVERAVIESCERRAPAESLLSLADGVGADLIAVGSHRYGRLVRWVLGSVTTQLVRDGRCSLLVVPPTRDASHGAGGHPRADGA